LFLWNNTFQPYRRKIKAKLLKELQKNSIGHVIVGDWKRDGCKIENYCSDRPSNEELKDIQ
jgi:hypothetical protein